MNQFNLKISYLVDGKQQEFASDTDKLVTDKVSVTLLTVGNSHKLLAKTLSPIDGLKIMLSQSIEASDDDFYYSNGYQSWTLTREYTKTDRQQWGNALVRPIVRACCGHIVGDYDFVKYPTKKGVFNSASYTYFRKKNSQSIRLFGSLDDTIGYTYFTYNFASQTLHITKDLEGKTFDGEYTLLNFININGDYDSVFDEYFAAMNIKCLATKPLKGYTSWYNYFRNIDEKIILRDLENVTALGNQSINCFQIDDGYQPTIGDLTDIDTTKFPNGLKVIADAIHAKSLLAGLWLCPFGATQKSAVYREHFDWIVKDKQGKPIKVGIAWGGFYCLDFYNPNVQEYVRKSIKTMTDDWGFDVLKMDFLYCACATPRTNKTRAEIMYEVMDFLRDCAGDAQIIGCGVPLMPAFGKVDYCRIGADVSLGYSSALDYAICNEIVSTRKTLLNSIFRRCLNGRAFYNDTDVCILRDTNTSLSKEQQLLLATINKLCGGVLFVSDNIGEYDKKALELFSFLVNDLPCKLNSANFENKRLLTLKYTYDGKNRILCYDHKSGAIILDKIEKE